MDFSENCIALVPTRDFRTGKSRLAPVLSPEERDEIGRWMLERVLASLREAASLEEVAVLSDSDEVLTVAGEQGAVGLWCPARDMNVDLEMGKKWARDRGAQALLVVPGDLPALRPEEVEGMLERERGRGMVIAPSPDGGTNGLFIRPADVLSFSFGPGSFARHEAEAERAGLRVSRFESPGFRLDVDTSADLEALRGERVLWPEWLSVPIRS